MIRIDPANVRVHAEPLTNTQSREGAGMTKHSEEPSWTSEDHARHYLAHVEELVRSVLPPQGNIDFPQSEESLRYALRVMALAFEELSEQFLNPLKGTNPEKADQGYKRLEQLISAVFLAGLNMPLEDKAELRREIENKNIANGRTVKAARDEIIIPQRRTVERSLLGDPPYAHPNTIAAKKLDMLNEKLANTMVPIGKNGDLKSIPPISKSTLVNDLEAMNEEFGNRKT